MSHSCHKLGLATESLVPLYDFESAFVLDVCVNISQ